VESVLEKSRGLGEAEEMEAGQQPERSPSKVTFSEDDQVTLRLTMVAGGVNFTNVLGAAFAPKSFCQKITNPNFKHIKAAQRALV
jgi:hypothetical protein